MKTLTQPGSRIVAHNFAGKATWDVSDLIRAAANVGAILAGASSFHSHGYPSGVRSLHALNGRPC